MSRIRHHMSAAAGCLAVFLSLAAAHAGTTANLLVNGDAEVHRCTEDWTAQTPIPGWRVVRGAASVLCYSAFHTAHETALTPSEVTQGKALFGAPGADTDIEQDIDVSRAASAIDRDRVTFSLSGWLGGWRDRPERAVLTALFLDAQHHASGDPVVIADVDAAARANKTGLLQRHASGPVPRGTRTIVVSVQFLSGMPSFHNVYADNLSLTLSGEVDGLAAAAAQPPVADVPALDHVYVVMMENTNYADIVHTDGRSLRIDDRMPFLSSLAARGVLLSNTWGTYHPSDQNYVAMVAGDTYRFGAVYYPDYDLPVTHLGDLLDAHGKSWRAYVQHMRTPCNLKTDGNYAPDDQPFAQFRNVIANTGRCSKALRDLTDFEAAIASNQLPDFAWIAADGWWDGEGAWFDNFNIGYSLAKQDEFLKSTFKPLLESENWRTSRSLLIVTWDESLGWGWPDNHVATIAVGSPGLLREGAVIGERYDGYSVLRTIETAFRLGGLHRFDEFAAPLNAVFASRPDREREGHLLASEASATRGSLADTFGRVAIPTAVERGMPLSWLADDIGEDAIVNLEPLGRKPTADSTAYRFNAANGTITIPTEGLTPGYYEAWLHREGEPPAQAPLPAIVLPPVTQNLLGVAIVGADIATSGHAPLEIREGSNFILRYCAPPGATTGNTWIGLFAEGTPPDQMTKANANLISNWLRTPGVARPARCGEAMAFPAELTPGTTYQALLFEDDAAGRSTSVGQSASFVLTPALP